MGFLWDGALESFCGGKALRNTNATSVPLLKCWLSWSTLIMKILDWVRLWEILLQAQHKHEFTLYPPLPVLPGEAALQLRWGGLKFVIHESAAIDEMLKLCTGHTIIFQLTGCKSRWLFKSLAFLHQGKGETTSLKLFSQLRLLLPFPFSFFSFWSFWATWPYPVYYPASGMKDNGILKEAQVLQTS